MDVSTVSSRNHEQADWEPQDGARIPTGLGWLYIVRAGEDDVDGAFDIMVDTMKWVCSIGVPQPEWLFTEEGRAHIRKAVTYREFYLAFCGSEPVASLWISPADPPNWGESIGNDGLAGYIHGFGVKRAFAGNGIGRALLDWASARIAELGRKYVRLDCDGENPGICRYYESLGFRERGSVPNRGSFNRLFERATKRVSQV
ncbi:MAG: GNAT family N-acetyltransferase [Clostridia bacterium]|nr:GNAT family N-acetyltransferase [Clostridia bacterium]